MRKTGFHSIFTLAALSCSSLALAAISAAAASPGPARGRGTRHYDRRGAGSIATLNRHTGAPHEHKREIARRRRQTGQTA